VIAQAVPSKREPRRLGRRTRKLRTPEYARARLGRAGTLFATRAGGPISSQRLPLRTSWPESKVAVVSNLSMRSLGMARSKKQTRDTNPDPITGEPGSHPVGTGVGAAVAGAAAGAAGGALGGPAGAVAGAVIGGVAGGYAGKAVGESIDPTAEDAYWRQNYQTRSYAESGADYDLYRPAYQYGWESYGQHRGRTFEEVEPELSRGWSSHCQSSSFRWEKAKDAARGRLGAIGARGQRRPGEQAALVFGSATFSQRLATRLYSGVLLATGGASGILCATSRLMDRSVRAATQLSARSRFRACADYSASGSRYARG
jgi:hypothetical protein